MKPACGALVAALVLGGCGPCVPLVGPEGTIASALQAAERGARFQAGRQTIELKRARFDRVLVKPEGEGYTAVATVDVEGAVVDGPRISYLGLERIPFVERDGRWVPREALLPALAQVVALLQARDAALASRDPAALAPLLAADYEEPGLPQQALLERLRSGSLERAQAGPATALLLRVERGYAELLEELPPSPSGPRRARLVLRRDASGFRFASGLR